MKKIVHLLIIVDILLLTTTMIVVGKFYSLNKALYENTTMATFTYKDSSKTQQKNASKELETIAKNHQVILRKILWSSEKEVDIYTNDPKQIKNEQTASQFLGNRNTQNKNQKGKISWIDNRQEVKIYSLQALENKGLEGVYYLAIQSRERFSEFRTAVEKKLRIAVQDENVSLDSLLMVKSFFSEPLLIATIILLFFATTFAFLFTYITSSKKIAVLKLQGYTLKQQLLTVNRPYFKTFFWGILFSQIEMIGWHGFVFKSYLSLGESEKRTILCLGILFLYMNFLSFLWCRSMELSANFHQYVKEKKPVFLLFVLSKVFILLFLALAPIFIQQSVKNYQVAKQIEKGNLVWEKAKNIYQYTAQYVGNESALIRPYEKKIKEYYLKNKENIALMVSDNYDTLSSGEVLYRANTPSKIEEWTNPYGRSVVVNATYLKWHTVQKENGEVVGEHDLKQNQQAVNLLVPTSLKKYEKEIVKNYARRFVLETFDWPKEEYPKEKFEKRRAEVKIIWVRENQRYFSYKDFIQPKTNNEIVNPIAWVDVGNRDSYQYFSWISQSMFFKKEKGKSAYETIYPMLKKYNVTSQIQLVESVYGRRSLEIESAKQKVVSYMILFIFSVFATILCLVTFIYSLYEKNKKKILLKVYYGYGPWRIFYQHFLLWLAVDSFVLTVSGLVNCAELLPFLVLLLLITELAVIGAIQKKQGEKK